jgi:hypothetical protein
MEKNRIWRVGYRLIGCHGVCVLAVVKTTAADFNVEMSPLVDCDVRRTSPVRVAYIVRAAEDAIAADR